MSVAIEMPRYQCHKKVWALKIFAVLNDDDGALLKFADRNYAPKQMNQLWANKHNPQAGGYYVVYEDGYESYSPAEAFENGYTAI